MDVLGSTMTELLKQIWYPCKTLYVLLVSVDAD